jgi:mannose-6-phosphate isomerase-like protein (cupin superfamily)
MSPPSTGPLRSLIDVAPQRGEPEPLGARPAPQPRAPGPTSLAPPCAPTAEEVLEELHMRLSTHPFWDNRLLQACRRRLLTREDFELVFSQYALLTRSEARFIHALLAQCDSEAWCARLTQALWEEVGAQPPERRPAALFRRFLRDGLGVDAESIRFHDATRYFVKECLDWCLRAAPCAASAFLAFGLEAPVPRLYSVLVGGLIQAGVPERHLRFFFLQIEARGARAKALEELVLSHAQEPGWADTCLHAMERALELQRSFFEGLYEAVQHRRLAPLMERIQARLPLAPERPEARTVHLGDLSEVVPFYRHTHELRGIDFTVDRVPFRAEVLETSLVRVAPGHCEEAREHAYEVLLVVLGGTGKVLVRGTVVDVKPGDVVFIPRWASHQARNPGAEPLTLLVVTDHGFTRRAHADEVLRATRLKRSTGVEL